MDGFVNVPVPVDRVHEVYRLLAGPPAGSTAGPQVTENGYPDGWSQSMIERMFIESSTPMRRILSSIAKGTPGWVTTGEIGEASGLTTRQVVASMGPFGKRIRGRYGMNQWPFETRHFADAGAIKYSMSPGTAAGILELLEQVEEHQRG